MELMRMRLFHVEALAAIAISSAAGCGSSDSNALFARADPNQSGGPGGTFSWATSGGAAGRQPFVSGAGAGGLVVMPSGTGGIANVGAGGGGGAGVGATPQVDGGIDAGNPLNGLPPQLQELAKCNFTGTWATFVSVPVSWPGAPFVLVAGQGQVKQWTLSHRVQDSLLNLHETVVGCSIFLPDLVGSILTSNQKFGIRFPNAVFDKTQTPYLFKTTASLVGSEVQWSTEPVATLTGLSLPGPATDAWPSPAVASTFRDDDMDGNPGVTVIPVDPSADPSYNWPPVGLPQYLGQDYPRAKSIFIVARSVAALHGTVTSCDELHGAAEIKVIGSQPAINSTVVGCVRTDGQTCVQSEADFLNQNRPQFVPSGPGTLISVRLPDNATCADARARFPN